MNALALSPHLDDAAFSAGGLIARLGARGWRVTIATLMTASVARPEGFALACQLDKGLPADADYMAIRRAEDRAACAALGAEAVHCPFVEAPHRGYETAAALFGPPHAGDAIVPALADAIGALVARLRPALILAPRALGGHVDHVQVVRALAVRAAGPRVLCWTDWPYAERAAPADPFAGALGPARRFELTVSERAAKAAACAAYASQLGFQFGGAEALAEQLDASTSESFARAVPGGALAERRRRVAPAGGPIYSGRV